MARYDFRTPRLYVEAPLVAGDVLALDPPRVNYLRNVMRLRTGDRVLAFNGRDGEWAVSLAEAGKKGLSLKVEERLRTQTEPLDLHYLFAPLKHARLDYMVQKAVEMGVSRLQPVLTRHTQAERVNLDRMRANAIEAAEQCGILTLPEVVPPVDFRRLLEARDPRRWFVFCDEDAPLQDPVAALTAIRPQDGSLLPLAVLVGPEGGFADTERSALLKLPNTIQLALGPRILRADTAAVAALALVGAVLGDWR